MQFSHAPALWEAFPQLVPGVLFASGITAEASSEASLAPWLERARTRLSSQTEAALPEVAAWRRAYAQMGLKPTQYRSAAEALLRRFRRTGEFPRLHPLVDVCNALSLAFALPVAVFDLDQVDTALEVRPATGSERYLAFDGSFEHPDPNEVIFADAASHAHARRWTFRQSRQSIVQPTTRRVLIVCEGLHTDARSDVAALLGALSAELSALWAPPPPFALLSAREPRFSADV